MRRFCTRKVVSAQADHRQLNLILYLSFHPRETRVPTCATRLDHARGKSNSLRKPPYFFDFNAAFRTWLEQKEQANEVTLEAGEKSENENAQETSREERNVKRSGK